MKRSRGSGYVSIQTIMTSWINRRRGNGYVSIQTLCPSWINRHKGSGYVSIRTMMTTQINRSKSCGYVSNKYDLAWNLTKLQNVSNFRDFPVFIGEFLIPEFSLSSLSSSETLRYITKQTYLDWKIIILGREGKNTE